MRINFEGTSESARQAASLLARAGVMVTGERPDLTITINDAVDGDAIVIDGVDCELERSVVSAICDLTSADVALRRRAGEVHSENQLLILVPRRAAEAVEVGVMRGVVSYIQAQQQLAVREAPNAPALDPPVQHPFPMEAVPSYGFGSVTPPTEPKTSLDLMAIVQTVALVLILLLLAVGKAHGQGTNVNVKSVGGVAVSANGSGAIKVTCPDGTCSGGGGGGGGGTISVLDALGVAQTVGYDAGSTNAPVALMTAIPVGANVIGKITISQGGNDATVSAGGALKVDGSAVTQPVSASSLPLPTGAATAAKQPALGTAGSPSADVITIQGVASMTAVKVDGSAVTQPVSGTVTATQSTASSLKAQVQVIDGAGDSAMDNTNDALRVNVVAGGAGDGAILDGVSSSIKATVLDYTNSNPIAVRLTDTSGDYVGAGAGTQYSNGSAQATPTGTVSLGWDTANVRALRTDSNGRLSVDVNSAPTTAVTGTVTANLGTLNGAATAAKQPALGTAGTASADVITVQGIASMTALKVDGSAVTQPVSGTITANIGTSGSLALESGGNLASVATNTTNIPNAIGTAASAIPSRLVQVGGSDGTNARAIRTNSTGQMDIRPLTSSDQVTIVPSGTQTISGTVTANAGTGTMSTNVAQLAGTTTDTNSGNKSAGTLRVVLATDQPQLTNKLLVTPDANSAVNVAQLAGNTISSGNGTSGTGALRAAVVSDNTAIANWGHAAIGAAPPTGSTQVSGIASGATGGLLAGITVCDSFANVNQTANTQIITGTSGRRIYICSVNLVTASAQNVAIVAGTGTVCATSTVAVPGTSGGTTAATGWNFAANAGIAHGSGLGAIAKTTVNGDNLCILQSGSGQLSGGISYAIY